jgi:hypothetical protein
MFNTRSELRAWQKLGQPRAHETLAQRHVDLNFFRKLLTKRTSSWKTEF